MNSLLIFKLIGVVGILLISIGMLVRKRKSRDKCTFLGGLCLLTYSIFLKDIVFILMQSVYIIVILYDFIKTKKFSNQENFNVIKKVYLAGQPNEYANNWKDLFKNTEGFEFYDWEIHSDQASPDTFFPDDMRAVHSVDILIANPGIATSESTWIEIGAFYDNNTDNPGDFCDRIIIIWSEDRNPKWSIEFVKKVGHIVYSTEEALEKLKELNKNT